MGRTRLVPKVMRTKCIEGTDCIALHRRHQLTPSAAVLCNSIYSMENRWECKFLRNSFDGAAEEEKEAENAFLGFPLTLPCSSQVPLTPHRVRFPD